jgi:hypothetical protein
MTLHVVLKAGNARAKLSDLSWEGEFQLQVSVGPVLRGQFLGMDLGTLKAIALQTEVTLLIESLPYELVSVNRSAVFEAIATGA